MPRKRTQKIYFGVEQEEAVIRYLQSESESDRNKIFNEYLKDPLIIMAESITRRYKLYRKRFEFNEQLTDTMSFLMTKVSKFEPAKNKKAYSYFGTICKNYLMGAIQKDAKEMNRTVSYDDISTDLEENPELSYIMDEMEIDYKDIIIKLSANLEEFKEQMLQATREPTAEPVPVGELPKPIEIKPSERPLGGGGRRCVSTPSGKCPVKLNSNTREDVELWAHSLMDYAQKQDVSYTVSALKYWVRDTYEVSTDDHKLCCEHLESIFLG